MKLIRFVRKVWLNGKFAFSLIQSTSERQYVIRWLLSLQPNYLLTKPIPWTTFNAIDFLSGYLQPGYHVFEYGSGGSTLFFLRHGVHCISIEHDTKWYELIKQRFSTENMAHVEYRLVTPEPSDSDCADPADPDCYVSADTNYMGMNFRAYASQIDDFPNSFFDVVYVDGRARPSCIAHALPKVKVGGVLLLDNSDRRYYTARTETLLEEFEPFIFVGVLASRADFDQCTAYVRRI